MGEKVALKLVRCSDIPKETTGEDRAKETKYRQGYMHGYSRALDDFLQALDKGKFPRHKEAWNHLVSFVDGPLYRWAYKGDGGFELPPNAPAVVPWQQVREFVLDRDGRKCVWCGETSGLECDHIVAVKDGGTSTPENLRTLCSKCHQNRTHIERVLKSRGMVDVISYGFNDLLQCHLERHEVSCDGGVRFYFPRNNCCDMYGAISLAKLLSPEVELIETFAGDQPDTMYQLDRESGEWNAYKL